MHLKFLIRIISYIIFKSLSLYPSNSYRILIEHLFGKSFKFTERATTDRFIVIKYYVNVLRYKIRPLNKLNDNKILIFDNNSKAKQLRIDFLSYYLKTRNFSFISYEDLCFFETKFEKIIFIFISIPFIFIVFISSQFFKYKSSLALFIEYSIVISNLLKILNKNNQLRKIYYFSIFERESNFFSNEIIKQTDIEVVKISSDTPLIFWNKFILCDKLLLCNSYQYDELKSNQIFTQISDVEILGPERSFTYRDLYDEHSSTPSNTIGFYSTASWVREKNNAIFQGIDFAKMELRVLKVVKQVILENKKNKLFIFLHPKEKKYSIEYLKTHYSNILGSDINFKFLNYNQSTAQLFDKIDLGISFNSTVIHERLYCGFKSLLFPNNTNFPLKNSPLSNICANSAVELKELIDESLKITTLNFFKKFDLQTYSFRKINL